MTTLTVDEAAGTYQRAMINIAKPGPGVCSICRTFNSPEFDRCFACGHQPNRLDAVAPITYSVAGDAVHHALRYYKDGVAKVRSYAAPRLAGILWRFSERHEACIAREAGVAAFDLVTTVPSSSPEGDERRANLRWIVDACDPLRDRFERVLRATGQAAPGRDYDESRYAATGRLDDRNVLLIDDTWTAGGHAQSAAHALKAAGARSVGLIVMGRHIHRNREIKPGDTNADRLDALPTPFDWSDCAVH